MFRPAFPFPTSFMEDLGEEFIQIWMPVPGNLASPEGSPSCDPVKDATLCRSWRSGCSASRRSSVRYASVLIVTQPLVPKPGAGHVFSCFTLCSKDGYAELRASNNPQV